MTLLDEPFSALDALTRTEVRQWFVGVAKELGLSALVITHDVDEAVSMASRIYVLAGVPAVGEPSHVIGEVAVTRPAGERSFELTDEYLAAKRRSWHCWGRAAGVGRAPAVSALWTVVDFLTRARFSRSALQELRSGHGAWREGVVRMRCGGPATGKVLRQLEAGHVPHPLRAATEHRRGAPSPISSTRLRESVPWPRFSRRRHVLPRLRLRAAVTVSSS